jgi:choline kinase
MSEVPVIILAAGVGSRLRPLTDRMPKCLVPVAERPVLGWQLEAFLAAGASQITVVAGYRSHDVIEFCRPYGSTVRVLVNSAYETTNNMVSLRLGLSDQQGLPMVVSNGDVVFDPWIALSMMSHDADLIAVQGGRYIEESMKVVADGDGRVRELSKKISAERAYGVSIDLYRFSATGIRAVCDAADAFIDRQGETNLWTEAAIDAALPKFDMRMFEIGNRPWIEIDNADDLAEGERLFAGVRA